MIPGGNQSRPAAARRESGAGRPPSAISLRIRRWVSITPAAEPRPRLIRRAVQRPFVAELGRGRDARPAGDVVEVPAPG